MTMTVMTTVMLMMKTTMIVTTVTMTGDNYGNNDYYGIVGITSETGFDTNFSTY